MKPEFSVREAVEKRYSVRTFDEKPLAKGEKDMLLHYAQTLQNPLGPKMRVQLIEKTTAAGGEKLGTYGIIRGAQTYLAALMPDKPCAPEALGYDFEKLVLYAASMDIGTCWLGGTFNRSAFAAQIDIGADEIFAILSPVGYPAGKKRIAEKLFRGAIGASSRKPWHELFFADAFGRPLDRAEAGEYAFPLDMLRLAPSAVNKQPWRVLRKGNAFHFYKKRGSGIGGVDMQRIDVGIGICHFHLAAMEKGLKGRFERCAPDVNGNKDLEYIVSWICE